MTVSGDTGQAYRRGLTPGIKYRCVNVGKANHLPLRAGPAVVEVVVGSRSRHSSCRESRKGWQQLTDDAIKEHGKDVHRAKDDSG